MLPPDRIYDICKAIRDAVVAHYITLGVDLPDRRYVANGPLGVVHDCEQLVVSCGSTAGYEGDPTLQTTIGLTRGAGRAMRSGVFSVAIARCIPVRAEEPVEVLEEEANARLFYADATNMLNALVVALKAGDLPGCGELVFLDWTAPGADSLDAGTLRVQIGLTG